MTGKATLGGAPRPLFLFQRSVSATRTRALSFGPRGLANAVFDRRRAGLRNDSQKRKGIDEYAFESLNKLRIRFTDSGR